MPTTWHPVPFSEYRYCAKVAGHQIFRDLNDILSLDAYPVRVETDGTITEAPGDAYAPDGLYTENGGDPDIPEPWQAMNGYSGQDGYRGPVMHPSELIGGRMARDIAATPGLYVVVVVTDFSDGDDDPGADAGWIVLRQDLP